MQSLLQADQHRQWRHDSSSQCNTTLDAQVVVGRLASNTLTVEDAEVSGTHLILRWQEPDDGGAPCWQVRAFAAWIRAGPNSPSWRGTKWLRTSPHAQTRNSDSSTQVSDVHLRMLLTGGGCGQPEWHAAQRDAHQPAGAAAQPRIPPQQRRPAAAGHLHCNQGACTARSGFMYVAEAGNKFCARCSFPVARVLWMSGGARGAPPVPVLCKLSAESRSSSMVAGSESFCLANAAHSCASVLDPSLVIGI